MTETSVERTIYIYHAITTSPPLPHLIVRVSSSGVNLDRASFVISLSKTTTRTPSRHALLGDDHQLADALGGNRSHGPRPP